MGSSFQTNLDVLDFTELGDSAAVSLTKQGGNTVVGVGDVTVTLEGIGVDALNASNFLGAGISFASFSSAGASAAPDVAGDAGGAEPGGQDAGPGAVPDTNEGDIFSSLVPENGLAI